MQLLVKVSSYLLQLRREEVFQRFCLFPLVIFLSLLLLLLFHPGSFCIFELSHLGFSFDYLGLNLNKFRLEATVVGSQGCHCRLVEIFFD